METFQLLYLRESVLEKAEEVRVRDVLEAIRRVAGQPPDVTIELWQKGKRVGLIGPSQISWTTRNQLYASNEPTLLTMIGNRLPTR